MNLTREFIWPKSIAGSFFADLVFQLDQSSLIQSACGSKACQHRVQAMRGRNVQARLGAWRDENCATDDWTMLSFWNLCLTCLLNSYCMWCSINNVFGNYWEAILKKKYSYWISTVIYLPALLPSQSPVANHLIYVFNKHKTEYSTAFLCILK